MLFLVCIASCRCDLARQVHIVVQHEHRRSRGGMMRPWEWVSVVAGICERVVSSCEPKIVPTCVLDFYFPKT